MRKSFFLLMSFLLFAFTAAGCGSINNQERVTVNIAGLQGPTSVGMIKMIEDNPLLGQNVEVKYQIVSSPDIMVSKLVNKEVDFAAIPTNLAAKIYNKGVDYKLAAISTWGVLYIVGNEPGIKEWKDLKGKTINSIGKGTTPDFILRYLLDKNGLDPEQDIKIDYSMEQVELAQAVIADKVKLALLPEPFVTMTMKNNNNIALIMNLQDEWNKITEGKIPFAQSGLVVSGEFAQKNPDIVAKALEEYQKSIDWVNNNPGEAGILVEKHNLGIKADIAGQAIPRCNQKYEDIQTAKEAVNSYFKIIYDFSANDLGGKLPDENFYYQK
ncbi:MAG TPA: ABC transporter substrate-binding protein [Desulfitobacteriaceae bacterium]|jgi:NitT/TauT family transport system substrate-binding protein|nr:ABC transporter substrate-binding protein [Desulfitobacteriaceae bacterium]